MYFPLKVAKTIQAIGVIFREDRLERMNYMRLLKLLYIADRESIVETGRPITGGPVVAMERGPVLEEVYDLIRGRHQEMPLWSQFFQKDRYDLQFLKDPDVGKLSRYEITKLQEVARRHENDDEWALSKLTHTFPEWQKNDPGQSCRPISLDDLLAGVGQQDSAREIAQDALEQTHLHRLFGG